MPDEEVHVLTVVAEGVLEERLIRFIESIGASGWTATPCHGRSVDGVDAGDFEGGNVRIEVLVPSAQLEAMWQRLDAEYFGKYGVVAWSSPVRVHRSTKFLGASDPKPDEAR